MATYDYDVEYSKDYVLQTSSQPLQASQLSEMSNKRAIIAKLKEMANNDPEDDFEFAEDDILIQEEEPESLLAGSITTPVHIGEKCTIEFAKRLNIFDSNNYIINLEQTDLDKLNTYTYDDAGNLITNPSKSYNICQVNNNKSYENCALATSNLYLATTFDSSSSAYVCTIPDKIKLPQNSKYRFTQSSTSNIIKPESEIYFKNLKKNFCEERWHDWFCIPNYHLNNRWFNEVPTELTDSKSIGKCFKPCPFSYIPTEENIRKCVLKKQYNGGAYKYDFDYTPIALVCLLGTTFQVFNREYRIHLENRRKDFNASSHTELLKNTKYDVIQNIQNTIESKENVIWQSMQSDMKQYINEMFTSIPDINNDIIYTNVVPPSTIIQNEMKLFLTTEAINHAYKIAEDIQSYMGDLEKYKEWVSELQSISGLTKEKLIYLIRMLKRACNVCFDGKDTGFSRNYLLYSINKSPIIIDEQYEPFIEEIKVNNFNYIQKKERWYFDDYVNDFHSYKDAIYTFLYFVIVVICIFILYVVYIVFYSTINQVLNSFITLIIFMYFDIKYYLYRYLVNSYAVDDREYQKLTFMKKLYQTFVDYDIKNYL